MDINLLSQFNLIIAFNSLTLKTFSILSVLVQTPNDLLLKETKAKILVSLDRHQETLDWLMEEDLPPHIQLVRCYCLYKTSSPENAWQTLSKLSQRLDLTPFAERTKKTLEAQIVSGSQDSGRFDWSNLWLIVVSSFSSSSWSDMKKPKNFTKIFC